MSRIGKTPIPVPSGVDVTIAGAHITVKGPKGTLERDIPGAITVRQDGEELLVERPNDERQNRAMHGLGRALVNNMVVGVTDGFVKDLDIIATASDPKALASALADELLGRFPVERVSVRVRKPEVVLDPPVEYAAVRATRP